MITSKLHRRSFLTGLVSALAAPAIIRYDMLMPVKVMPVVSDLELLWNEMRDYGHLCFGLAPLKKEGEPIAYDYYSKNTWIVSGTANAAPDVADRARMAARSLGSYS